MAASWATVTPQMFDATDWKTTFAVDRSPLYNIAPGAAAKLAKVSPNARVVLVVCDPITRAWSSINHENKRWLSAARRRNEGHAVHNTSAEFDAMASALIAKRFESAIAIIDRATSHYGRTYQDLLDCVRDLRRRAAELKRPDLPHHHFGMSEDSVCREVLLPGFYFDGLRQYVDSFQPQNIVVVHGDWLFHNQQEGARQLYRALGVPTELAITEGRHAPAAHANEGSRVNPMYRDISQMPASLQSKLHILYNATIMQMAHLFGAALPNQ
jgi:hypothetical protein